MKLMHRWFIYLFNFRKNNKGFVKCYECEKWMHEDNYKMLSSCYSHILNKTNYKQYAGKPWNLKITHPECHQLFELFPQKAIKQHSLYLELLEKHKNGELQ